MFGCEWDNETGKVNGFNEYGYDGEDFIEFDLRTETWVAPTPQAFITKHKWDNDRAGISKIKNYLTQECPDQLKKFLNYRRSSLLRTDRPSVSLLQKTPSSNKTPSSPVSCHATGFYPDRAIMFWRKDGEELHEDVDQGEILPNHDGTFQMRRITARNLNCKSVNGSKELKLCCFDFSSSSGVLHWCCHRRSCCCCCCCCCCPAHLQVGT
uniref:Ig-like domain-containing protein n=1 Tax=Lates calcarifer TaxID=8187 RepID=A0A4W6FL80_LATCA